MAVSRLLRLPERGRSGPWIVALGLALILAFQPMWYDRVAIAVVIAIGLTLALAARWQLRWLPVVVLIMCGIALRLAFIDREASDVADVTSAAILSALFDNNPYGVGYHVSRPAGAAFPYGPVALLWYLPMRWDPATLELLISIGLMGYFGLRAANGRPIGLAIFALAPPLVLAAVDGSNDTSAGLMIMAALIAGFSRPALGAALLAVAVAFKPYAGAWLLPMIAWAGLPVILAFGAASLIAWSPVIFVWGIESYLRSLAMAQETHLRSPYWSVAAIWDGIVPGAAPKALETIRYAVAGVAAVLGSLKVRSMDGVILVGTVVFVIAQFGGYFGSYVYIAAVAPILCWRVDDWVRMGLPELQRAYGFVPALGHRTHRSTLAPESTPPSPVPARLGGALRTGARSRRPDTSRTPSG